LKISVLPWRIHKDSLFHSPAGLYISALCNYAKEEEILLKLSELKTEINLVGFRLPKGKRLVIEGDAGDFTGIGLEGGELVVDGNTKNWTGAGMRSGKILIKKNIGLHTGEWMMGGEIYVGGRIRGLGNIVEGKVFEREKLSIQGRPAIPISTTKTEMPCRKRRDIKRSSMSCGPN
jgi:formylmethanofuran dehydrogenase subunit C